MEKGFIIIEDKHPPGFVKSAGVIGGIVGGLILMIAGLILSAISHFNRTSFQGAEMVILIASVGFLFVGAHTLDLIEKRKKERRAELGKDKSSTDGKCTEYNVANP